MGFSAPTPLRHVLWRELPEPSVGRRGPIRLMPWLVGATAGLVSVQFQNVNAFTFVTVIWFISVIRRPSRHRNSLFLVPLCVLPVAATVVTGDLVSNPLLAVQLLAFAANAAMIYAKSTEDDSRLMLRGLLHVCTIGAIVGLLQVTGALDYGVWHYPGVSYFGRPSGIYPEPDWLGMFGGIGALLAWRTMKLSTGRYIVLAINLSVFILAYARAAWVGLVFAIAMYALVSLYRARGGEGRRGRVVQGVVFLGVLSALTFAFAPPAFQTDLASRASSIRVRQPDDISSQARTRQHDGLVSLIASAPWYGHGISASGRVGVWGAYDQNSSNGVGTLSLIHISEPTRR